LLQLEIRLKDKLSDQFKWVIGVFLTLALMDAQKGILKRFEKRTITWWNMLWLSAIAIF